MKKPRKPVEGDDGRVIAPMNVEGMPWYTESTTPKTEESEREKQPVEMTREESRAFMWGVMKATLLICSVFCVAAALFILFCTEIWLK